jgi:hypothetical protein
MPNQVDADYHDLESTCACTERFNQHANGACPKRVGQKKLWLTGRQSQVPLAIPSTHLPRVWRNNEHL